MDVPRQKKAPKKGHPVLLGAEFFRVKSFLFQKWEILI